MMDYKIFLEVVKEKFLDYMPEQYKNARLEVHEVKKVNRMMDNLFIHMEGEGNTCPSMYVNEMYEKYKETGNLDETLRFAAEYYLKMIEQALFEKMDIDLNQLRDNVIFVLVNTEQNKEMLSNVPNKAFQDLSVVFRWVISQDEKGMSSALVDNNLMNRAGITPEELMNHAIQNTKRICPPRVASLEEMVMCSMGGKMDQGYKTMFDVMGKDPRETMWVITNQSGINGASAMLYEENLHKLAETVGTDLYLLPSSIHEWIVVSVEMGEPTELVEMVQEANMSVVALEERLSNNIYHYDKDVRKVTLATDVLDRRLDGDMAEAPMIYNNERKR